MRSMNSFLAAIVLMFAGVTMDAAQTAPPEKAMKVTLQIFSGRPNPEFSIKDAYLINRIQDLLETMPTTKSLAASAALQAVLGYTGIVVEPTDASLPLVETMTVYRSIVQVKNNTKAAKALAGAAVPEQEVRTDASSALEKLLIKEALRQGVIDQNVIEFMNK